MAAGSKTKGIKSTFTTVISFVVMAAVIMGWAKVNNITSIDGAYDYFNGAGKKVRECGVGDLKWDCGVSVDTGLGGSTTSPKLPEVELKTIKTDLSELSIGTFDANANYKRSEWRHWVGSPCDTRETVLKSQGKDVKTNPSTCKVLSGTWWSAYDNETVTDPKALDIDHLIPLGYAATHGGASWSADKKENFANDTSQLIAVTAKSNRSKSDKGPSEYMPQRGYRCVYSQMWIKTAKKYGVKITEEDKKALENGLKQCEG